MSSLHHLAFFLALVSALCFCNKIITAMDSTNEEAQARIHIHIALPKESKPVSIACSSGSFVVVGGQAHEWSVPVRQIESCHAIWGQCSASFNAFEPKTDAGHALIYWMAKPDGFFHSWDQVNWDKREDDENGDDGCYRGISAEATRQHVNHMISDLWKRVVVLNTKPFASSINFSLNINVP